MGCGTDSLCYRDKEIRWKPHKTGGSLRWPFYQSINVQPLRCGASGDPSAGAARFLCRSYRDVVPDRVVFVCYYKVAQLAITAVDLIAPGVPSCLPAAPALAAAAAATDRTLGQGRLHTKASCALCTCDTPRAPLAHVRAHSCGAQFAHKHKDVALPLEHRGGLAVALPPRQ